MKKRITLIILFLAIAGIFTGCENLFNLYSADKLQKVNTQGKFIAVGSNSEIYYSSNGVDWSGNVGFSVDDTYGVGFGNNLYVAVCVTGKVYNSNDGKKWLETFTTAGNLYHVAYGKGKFAACGADGAGNGGIYYSSDGKSWSGPISLLNSSLSRGICYGGDKFVTVGATGTVHYSSDGINWSGNVGPGTNDLYDVTYGKDIYVAVGCNAMGSAGEINYSADAINWTKVGPSSVFYGVCYGNGKFVAVGKDGLIHYSSDGKNWSTDVGPTTGDNFRSVVYGDGKFVAVGQNGLMYYSSDAKNWSAVSSPSVNDFFRITFTKYNIEFP